MQSRAFDIGDRVEVDVKGVRFPATVRSKVHGLVGIEPEEPKRYSWRTVTPRLIVRVLERQGRLA